jgi:hypothetical protein
MGMAVLVGMIVVMVLALGTMAVIMRGRVTS